MMTSVTGNDDLNSRMIDQYWIVEARDKKGDNWYQFGGKHVTLNGAEAYRRGNVLYKARYRKARIVEITSYRKILESEP